MREDLEAAALLPVCCQDRWAWLFQLWVLAGLAWLIRAKGRHEQTSKGSHGGKDWLHEQSVAIGVSPAMLLQAFALSEGRVPLLVGTEELVDEDSECAVLATQAALALLDLPPAMHMVVLRIIMRRWVVLADGEDDASFQTLSDRIVKPVLCELRAALLERAGAAGDVAADICDEVARLRKALVRILAVAVASQSGTWLGPDLAERLPVTALVPLLRAGPARRTQALVQARRAASKCLSITRIRRALEDGLEPPVERRPRNPITEQARQQRKLVSQLEVLEERAQAAGLAVTPLLVPTALLPARANRIGRSTASLATDRGLVAPGSQLHCAGRRTHGPLPAGLALAYPGSWGLRPAPLRRTRTTHQGLRARGAVGCGRSPAT